MNEERKVQVLVEATVELLRSAYPVSDPGKEVSGYMVPAEQYLQVLQQLSEIVDGNGDNHDCSC